MCNWLIWGLGTIAVLSVVISWTACRIAGQVDAVLDQDGERK